MYPGRRAVKLKCGLIAIDCHSMRSAIDIDGDQLPAIEPGFDRPSAGAVPGPVRVEPDAPA